MENPQKPTEEIFSIGDFTTKMEETIIKALELYWKREKRQER